MYKMWRTLAISLQWKNCVSWIRSLFHKLTLFSVNLPVYGQACLPPNSLSPPAFMLCLPEFICVPGGMGSKSDGLCAAFWCMVIDYTVQACVVVPRWLINWSTHKLQEFTVFKILNETGHTETTKLPESRDFAIVFWFMHVVIERNSVLITGHIFHPYCQDKPQR